MVMTKEYIRFLESQIADMRESLKDETLRPEYKERNKDLINMYLEKIQVIDNPQWDDNLLNN